MSAAIRAGPTISGASSPVIARGRPPRPFLRLRTLPGEQAQVDWGHFGHVVLDGFRRPLVAFVMVLAWSRQIFLRFGPDLKTGAFLRRHIEAFETLGGVPRVLLYDNLKSAVLQRVGDAIVFNPDLLAFSGHYHYEPRPAAPYRGNEKGRVERAIRYIRTSFFPAREWKDLEDLNGQAKAWCEGLSAERRCPGDRTRTVGDAFVEERGRLIALPGDRYPAEDRLAVAVGKTPYARFDLNDYTVPHDRVQRTLEVRATGDTVRVLDGSEIVAVHARSWGKGLQVEDAAHLATLVAHKREARHERGMDRLHHALARSEEFLQRVAERGSNLGSTTAGLLRLLDTHGAPALDAAIEEALAADAPHLGAVRVALDKALHAAGRCPPVAVALPDDPRVRDIVVKPHALASYDRLGRQDENNDA
ncbi:MAG: IS21 family transposase [Pseudomonadota bacterium]|nr:IS21 family transposase [Pseudomonadota bacterium]